VQGDTFSLTHTVLCCTRSKVKPKITEVEFGPKNFLTNPPRRGHYGQPGSLLGHRTEEARKLFEARSEPYGRKRELERVRVEAVVKTDFR